MNRFELFCMVFYALDTIWDETQDEELGNYLSTANPFMFDDIGSAVPEVYDKFCGIVEPDIDVKDSYDNALTYVKVLANNAVTNAFNQVDKETWDEGVSEYMSTEHKGS